MKYDSLDTIPFKLLLKIMMSNDYTLIANDRHEHIQAAEVWEAIKEEYAKLDPDNSFGKIISTLIEIEEYKAQYNAINVSICALRFDREIDLENELRSIGFKLTEENFQNDLDTIEEESKALLMMMEELEQHLPDYDENKKATNVDEVILAYSAFTGLAYTDTNAITGTQFLALRKTYEQKKKAVEEQIAKSKKKK